jgi:hypothetical protein
MIDKVSGAVRVVGDVYVHPWQPRGEIVAGAIGTLVAKSYASGDRERLELRVDEPAIAPIDLVALHFEGERLASVGISAAVEGDSKGWAGAYVAEPQREKLHDQLLKKWLGAPPYVFSWGTVIQTFNVTGSHEILIDYSVRRKWWSF